MDDNELMHYGILGMKWGVRRFQNSDGTLTPAGKKRYDKEMEKLKAEEKILKNKKRTQAKLDKLEAKQKQIEDLKKGDDDSDKDYEERKQDAIRKGSATDVLKFKGDLTPAEMQSALSRIRWERDMKDISDKELAAGKEKAKKFFDTVDNVTGYAVTASKAYNTVANLYNAFVGTDKKLLPTIQTGNTNDNRDRRKKEKKEQAKADEAKKKRAEQEAQRETKKKERAEKKAQEEGSYTGKVYGEGNDSYKPNKSYDVIDVEWRDVTTSDVPSKYTQLGERYVAGLLEEKKK